MINREKLAVASIGLLVGYYSTRILHVGIIIALMVGSFTLGAFVGEFTPHLKLEVASED